MTIAYLALGANLGDRAAAIDDATRRLAAIEGVTLVARSPVYETDPVGGPPGQEPYLNLVVAIESDASARQLLGMCHRIESAAGRVRGERWGPRTLDIDILLWGDLVRDDAQLTIPHPRLHERAFVVLPLLDLDAHPVLPDGRRLLEQSAPRGEARPVGPPLAMP